MPITARLQAAEIELSRATFGTIPVEPGPAAETVCERCALRWVLRPEEAGGREYDDRISNSSPSDPRPALRRLRPLAGNTRRTMSALRLESPGSGLAVVD